MRRVYLNELRTHGQKHLAAEAAGVSQGIVQAYKKNSDPDKTFTQAEALCLALRSESLVRRLESEFVDGLMEPKIDKEGNLIYWNKPTGKLNPDGTDVTIRVPLFIRKVESAARLRVLERHDPAYREHKEVDVNSKGGVLVVPAPASNLADWEAQVAAAKAAAK